MNAVKEVDLSSLKKHPKNYRNHPEDQLDHLCKSIEENGIYRPIIVTKDKTILAGHGVSQACKRLEIKKVPIIEMDIDPNSKQALKLLTADNEISNLAEINDRQLTEILKEIKDDSDLSLEGTGFDEMMLANLVMVTRDASEIKDIDHAKEWVGMPSYFDDDNSTAEEKWEYKVICKSEKDLKEFVKTYKVPIALSRGRTWSTKYPHEERQDIGSIRFESE